MIESFGGPKLPAFGFGAGLERILQTMVHQNVPFPLAPHPKVYLIGMGEEASTYCFELLAKLRKEKIASDMDLTGKKIQHGLQRAAALNAEYCLVIGEEELKTKKAELKNMTTRENKTISLENLLTLFEEING